MALLDFLLLLSVGIFTTLFCAMGIFVSLQRLIAVALAKELLPKHLTQQRNRINGRIISSVQLRAEDPNQTQQAPLSQTPCLAYQFSIVEGKGAKKAAVYRHSESRGQWNICAQIGDICVPIEHCRLELTNVHAHDSQDPLRKFANVRSHALIATHSISPKKLGLRRSLKLTECVLQADDRLWLFGKITTHPQIAITTATLTDKSRRRLVLEATAMLLGCSAVLWIATGILHLAFR